MATSPNQPARLLPVSVAKPWGREIWYSATERRGESRVLVGGSKIPLSRYLDTVGLPKPIILLKVLDPDPAPVRGDLYFEVHREKREVYVVAAIDRQAWPDGRGQIRFGMNQAMRARYADDERFRAAYLQAVREYEAVRRKIDYDEPVTKEPVKTHTSAQSAPNAEGLRSGGAVEQDLVREEARARAAMNAFTGTRRLAVGDVVLVPTWTPHALQHGVRVVEFQTPSYERYIISFNQKVLTQDGWDSAKAIGQLSLDPPPEPDLQAVAPGVERIASFADFGVWRASVKAGGRFALPRHVPYALCLAARGTIHIGPLALDTEMACLLPKAALARHAITADRDAHCLLAAPGL